MILVTIGTMPHFERLIRHMDELAQSIDEDVFMQIGESRYVPKHARWQRYVKDLDPYYQQARLIVSHGGFSTLETIGENKPLIVVPRQKRYGEHFDDHQVEFARILQDRYRVSIFLDVKQLTAEVLGDDHTPEPFDPTPVLRFRQSIHELMTTPSPEVPAAPSPVRSNVLAAVAGSVGANIANFLIGLLIVVSLGEAAHGALSIVMSLLMIATLLTLSGVMEAGGVREIARRRHAGQDLQHHIDQAIGTGLIASVVLGLILFGFAGPLSNTLGGGLTELIRLASIWPLSLALLRTGTMICDGFERMRWSSFCLILFHACRLAWVVVAFGLALTLENVLIGWAILMPLGGAACLVIGTRMLHAHGLRLRLSILGRTGAIRAFCTAIPLTILRSAAVILPSFAAVCVAFAGGDKPMVSYLMIGYGLASIPMMLSAAITNAVFPAFVRLLSQHDSTSHTHARRLLRRSLVTVVCIHLLAWLFFLIAGRQVLGLLYGEAYAQHTAVLLVLAAAVAVEAVRHLIDHALIAAGPIREVVFAELLRYAFLGLLIAVWVPAHGPIAAAIAIAIAALINLGMRPLIYLLYKAKNPPSTP